MSYYTYNYPIPEHLPEGDKALIREAYDLKPDSYFGQDRAQTEEARTILNGIERDKWYHRQCKEDAHRY